MVDRWKAISGSGRELNATKGDGRAVAARLREEGKEAVLLVIDWYAGGSGPRPAFLRASGYSLKTLTRAANFGEYLDLARAWAAAGRPRPSADDQRAANPALEEEGRKAWAATGKAMGRHARITADVALHPDPGKDAAWRAAIRAVGESAIRRATSTDEHELKTKFIAAYVAARGKQT